MKPYPSLSSPVPIKRPFRCSPGVEVIIDDIHPIDPKFTKRKIYLSKKAIVASCGASCYRRQESYSTNGGSRLSWAECALEINGTIQYFKAVRFHRVMMSKSYEYEHGVYKP